MQATWILGTIFTFIIIVSLIDNRYSLRKKKIDAALRMREMELGLPPGTYSSGKFKGRKPTHHPDASFEEWKQTSNRTELKKGIEDLQQRLANLETIMNNRKATPEGENDKEWKE